MHFYQLNAYVKTDFGLVVAIIFVSMGAFKLLKINFRADGNTQGVLFGFTALGLGIAMLARITGAL